MVVRMAEVRPHLKSGIVHLLFLSLQALLQVIDVAGVTWGWLVSIS